MEYSRLIFASFFGIFIFAELPEGNALAGASIIVASTLYVARREAMAKARKAAIGAVDGQRQFGEAARARLVRFFAPEADGCAPRTLPARASDGM